MGLVTVICSGKGGVGKSTTTVGLGRALASRGKRVLMMDCDAGLRTLDKITGVEESLIYDSSDIIKGNCPPIKAIYEVGNQKNLFVIPAPSTADDMLSSKAMEKLIPILKKYFDHVLLDCPAGLGNGFRAATITAEKVLVVCNPDPVSVRSASKVRDLILKNGNKSQRLIINKFNKELFENINSINDLDQVIDETGIRLIGVVPEDYSLSSAFFKGEEPNENSKGMLAYKRIAARLEGVNGPIII